MVHILDLSFLVEYTVYYIRYATYCIVICSRGLTLKVFNHYVTARNHNVQILLGIW